MFFKFHKRSAADLLRRVPLLALLWSPIGMVASCGSGGSTGDMLAEESQPQIACGGGVSTGGVSIGGIGGTTKGGTGGAGSCPQDTCTTFTCSRAGMCTPSTVQEPGVTCSSSQGRGHCGTFDLNGDRQPDYLLCCVDGCLNRDACLEFPDQSDNACGRLGSPCMDCGECKTCSVSGTCVATSGSCTNGQCLNGSCCRGCISGSTCIVDSATACGSNGGACVSCDDGRFCTTDTCSGGTCQHQNTTGSCNDGDECTVNDACSGSSCAGTPKDCNDQNVCTTDDCDAQNGCTHVPVAGSCNDGNACTNPDSCSNGTCAGVAVNCDDGNPCTTDGCNPMTGCTHMDRPLGAMCASDTGCASDFQCVGTPRVCRAQSGKDCEDGNPCTSDTPDCTTMPASCPHTALNNGSPCSTGNHCLGGETCQMGVCAGGMAPNCNDANPCTADACDAAMGCTHTPSNNGNTCNDGNPCTDPDACQAGDCVGEPVECVAIDDCHAVGTCDEDTGICNDPRMPNGTECGRTGTCQSGRCEGDGVVEPTGGTGPGTAGGGPGGGDTGGTGTGTAGDGAGDSGGQSTGGTGATGNTSGTSSAGSPEDTTPIYQREPGGCACRLPASTPARSDYTALAVASVAAFVVRRRRRAA